MYKNTKKKGRKQWYSSFSFSLSPPLHLGWLCTNLFSFTLECVSTVYTLLEPITKSIGPLLFNQKEEEEENTPYSLHSCVYN